MEAIKYMVLNFCPHLFAIAFSVALALALPRWVSARDNLCGSSTESLGIIPAERGGTVPQDAAATASETGGTKSNQVPPSQG